MKKRSLLPIVLLGIVTACHPGLFQTNKLLYVLHKDTIMTDYVFDIAKMKRLCPNLPSRHLPTSPMDSLAAGVYQLMREKKNEKSLKEELPFEFQLINDSIWRITHNKHIGRKRKGTCGGGFQLLVRKKDGKILFLAIEK